MGDEVGLVCGDVACRALGCMLIEWLSTGLGLFLGK